MNEQKPKNDAHWKEYRKAKESRIKKSVMALIFGCSAGFAVMFLYSRFGLRVIHMSLIVQGKLAKLARNTLVPFKF